MSEPSRVDLSSDLRLRILETLSELEDLGIPSRYVIFVGGSVLQYYGLRRAGDIDVIVHSICQANIPKGLREYGPWSARNLAADLQVLTDPYRSAGISDSDCFDLSLFHSFTLEEREIRVALPELEFAKKIRSSRIKDHQDVMLLQEIALIDSKWDWDLVPETPRNLNKGQTGDRGGSNRTVYGWPRYRRLFNEALGSPRQFLRKVKQRFVRQLQQDSKRLLDARSLVTSHVDTGVVLEWQHQMGRFNRYDLLIRLTAAEAWFAKGHAPTQRFLSLGDKADHQLKEDPFSQYRNMQMLRVGTDTVPQFKHLLQSVDQYGLNMNRNPLFASKGGELIDGAHRLAIAMALGIRQIPVAFKANAGNGIAEYDRKWFADRGFSEDILGALDRRLEELLIETGVTFQCVIWPPASMYTDEIMQDIAADYQVLGLKRNLQVTDFNRFVDAVYASDDVDSWKLQKKLAFFSDFSPKVTLVQIQVPSPEYRRKERDFSYLCVGTADLKNKIRKRYKGRIPGYFHDVVIHIGDNPQMNRDIYSAVTRWTSPQFLAEW